VSTPEDPREPFETVVRAERLDDASEGRRARCTPELVVQHAPAAPAAESFRSLYHGLRSACGGAPWGVLAVVSAARGEGRSTIAANLALMAARESMRQVALVDADLRAPALHRLFGVDGEIGLSDLLANRADADAALLGFPREGLFLMPGGRPEPDPARRFLNPRFARLLSMLRQRFDEVVIDLPPLVCADARIVLRQCSAGLLVVRAGRTEPGTVRELTRGDDAARLLGTVLNDASEADAPQLRATRLALPGRHR
jgi:succinoglycan biosynthesis transport protein ExoP